MKSATGSGDLRLAEEGAVGGGGGGTQLDNRVERVLRRSLLLQTVTYSVSVESALTNYGC